MAFMSYTLHILAIAMGVCHNTNQAELCTGLTVLTPFDSAFNHTPST